MFGDQCPGFFYGPTPLFLSIHNSPNIPGYCLHNTTLEYVWLLHYTQNIMVDLQGCQERNILLALNIIIIDEMATDRIRANTEYAIHFH
jgi:hypothetical protein